MRTDERIECAQELSHSCFATGMDGALTSCSAGDAGEVVGRRRVTFAAQGSGLGFDAFAETMSELAQPTDGLVDALLYFLAEARKLAVHLLGDRMGG